jgi:hypothetical protein
MFKLKNKFNKVFYLIVLTIFLSFMLPLTALAQDITGSINSFYNRALAFGGMAAVGVIVAGAIMYATSGAIDKKNLGKEMITSAIWGLVLLLGAFIVLNTINPELVELKTPEGPKIDTVGSVRSANCINYPNLDECGVGEMPEIDDEGNPSCCVSVSGICPSNIVDNCEPKVEDTSFAVPTFPLGQEWLGWIATGETTVTGTKWQHAYYPVLDGEERVDEAQCVVYAYRRNDMEDGFIRVNLPDKLRKCN